jgi:D-glycero-alpha-D-manno-heptose 1-phosphate guanylyltransferase
VVPDLPKPMAPIHERPFLAHQLDYWIKQGVTRFVISVGYKHEHIIDYFGHEYAGASLDYAVESTPLGTGGGLLLAASYLSDEESFLLLNGDTYFVVDLAELKQFATQTDADWVFSLFRTDNHQRYMGLTLAADGKVISLADPQLSSGFLANGGVYWVKKAALLVGWALAQQQSGGETHLLGQGPTYAVSLEKDLFPQALKLQQRLFGKEFLGDFIDIGVPEDYYRSESILA